VFIKFLLLIVENDFQWHDIHTELHENWSEVNELNFYSRVHTDLTFLFIGKGLPGMKISAQDICRPVTNSTNRILFQYLIVRQL
jgi:hypothetical protein